MTCDLVLRQLGDLVLERLDRAGDVALEDEVELLERRPPARGLKTSSSETLRPERRASASVFRRWARSSASCAGAAVVLDDADELAGLGDAVEAEHLDRVAGDGLLDALARVVVHRADACPSSSRRRRASPTFSVPRWTSSVTTGPRPGSSLDSMTTPEASAFGLALSSSSSATTWIVSSRSSRPCFVLADTSTNSVSPPHSAGCRPRVRHLGAHAGRVRALLVDLVDRDERSAPRPPSRGRSPRSVCGFTPSSAATTITAMSVTLGAAGAHGGERLVARACRGR